MEMEVDIEPPYHPSITKWRGFIIYRGTCRLVITHKNCPLAIKVARVYWLEALKSFWSCYSCFAFWKYFFRVPPLTIEITPQGLLLRGIIENWQEWRFYHHYHSSFCQPTYLSLLGFLNLQKKGQPTDLEPKSFWSTVKKLTHWRAENDHHFCNMDNFCWSDDGQLKIVDYHGLKTQKTILDFGSLIQQHFVKRGNDVKTAD